MTLHGIVRAIVCAFLHPSFSLHEVSWFIPSRFYRIGMHVSADGRKTAHQAGAGSTPSIGTNKLLGGIAAAGDSPDW